MLPGSPTGMVPVYAEPPASETPWIDWTCPACVKRSVVAVVAQLIPMLPWLPSWSSWICPVPSSKPCVGNPAIVPSAFWIWGMTWKTERGGGQLWACWSPMLECSDLYVFLCSSFFFYLILNARHSICCSLTPSCCNIYGLAGNTPNRKHVLPVGRDNPRVWNVNDSLVFLPSRYGSQHLPSIWARQLNGWHICRLGAQSKVTLTGTDHTSNRETVTPLSFRLDHSLAIVYQSGLDSETVQMHERNKWSTGRSRSCSI